MRVKPQHLARHLEGDTDKGEDDKPAVGSMPDIDSDFQLREALNLLKGVDIVRSQGRG